MTKKEYSHGIVVFHMSLARIGQKLKILVVISRIYKFSVSCGVS